MDDCAIDSGTGAVYAAVPIRAASTACGLLPSPLCKPGLATARIHAPQEYE